MDCGTAALIGDSRGGTLDGDVSAFIEFKRFTHSKSFKDNMQHQLVRVDTQVKAGALFVMLRFAHANHERR